MEHFSFPQALLLLAILGSALGLALWFFRRERDNQTKIRTQWEQTQQALDRARCEAIEEGLRGWLTMLRLPELEEQTKLKAAARQLRIVLVEKLMRGPRLR